MRRLVSLVVAWAACSSAAARPATDVKAFFREGQTFVTWTEDGSTTGERYRVYRHTERITPANLARAKRLAEVPEGSCRFREMWRAGGQELLEPEEHEAFMAGRVIPRLAIRPVRTPGEKPRMLPEGTGLFVHTAKDAEPVQAWYAVTSVAGGREEPTVGPGNTTGPVREVRQPIGAVRYHFEPASGEERRAREWYIMWMDHELWNPHYVGYAFCFGITPGAFRGADAARPAPLHLDGIGTMNVFTGDWTNFGCADLAANAANHATWYFGYGLTIRDGQRGADRKDTICNYIQYRTLQVALWARRTYNIRDPRFVVNGNSMGAAGAIGLALHFPKLVTAIWANQGLTSYANVLRRADDPEPMWTESIWGNYGRPALRNPARFLPFGDPKLDWVRKFNGRCVYDVRDAGKFLAENVAEDFPLLVIGHNFGDESIPAYSQALPFEKYIRNSRHCFSYTLAGGTHSWGAAWQNDKMIWLVRPDESRPGFSNVPPIVGWRYGKRDPNSRTYLYKVRWGVKAHPVGGKAVTETADSWSLPIVHEAEAGQEKDYVVDVTPRNLQTMKVRPGETFTYEIRGLAGAKPESTGEIAADKHGLLLVPKVPIRRSGALVVVRRRKK